MAHVVTQPCCNDAACVSVCPVNCIHPAPHEPGYGTAEMLYIDPVSCIDCGACVEVCPVSAIVADIDLTDETAPYEEINAAFYSNRNSEDANVVRAQTKKVDSDEKLRPLKVAIVGSGPAACYTAEELLLRRDHAVEVNMFEQLPTPWGLVRYGVAPDHQGTKAVAGLFQRTAGRRGMEMFLNVTVGKHVTHEELLESHDAVVYAVGASGSRRLDIPGEELPGSHSATEFVAWYNGHPDFADSVFDLSADRAVVIGNGNVALDVARLLVSEPQALAKTDMATHAVDRLAGSNIKEVVVMGRRGPAQAAYTTPELLALSQSSSFDVHVDMDESELDAYSRAATEGNDPIATVKLGILRKLASSAPSPGKKRIVLRYLASPLEVLGDDHVEGLRIAHNELVSTQDGRSQVRPTGVEEDIECGLVLRSIGYRGVPTGPLPIEPVSGTIANHGGRVTSESGACLTGVYVAGWIKRGPTGVIGTNKKCAKDTVEKIIEDHRAGRLNAPVRVQENLRQLISERQPDYLNFAGAKSIDAHERSLGRERGAPRIKLIDLNEMLRVAERPNV